MSFVQLIFLFGAFAVIGPIVAHLFAKPKFKRVPFTMLRFLHAGQKQRQSRRRFHDLLILLLRCTIIILIAMLFAQPRLLIESPVQKLNSVYYLGLDNSMSMTYSDGSESYFEQSIDSAVDYISSADEDGIFNICALASSDWRNDLNKQLALAEIRKLKIVPNSVNMRDFFSAIKNKEQKENLDCAVSVFVRSDFTPNMLDKFNEVRESVVVDNIDCKPIVSKKLINNAAVIDAYVSDIVDEKLIINVTVANYGQTEQNRILTAIAGQYRPEPVDIQLFKNQRRIYQVKIDISKDITRQSFLPIELSLSGSDGLNKDNTFYLAVSLPHNKKVNILLADKGTGETFLLKTAINTLSGMQSYNRLITKQISYDDITLSDLDWADVIICSEINQKLSYIATDLKKFVTSGGKIIFFVNSVTANTAEQLWEEGILAAMPRKCVHEKINIEPQLFDSQSNSIAPDGLVDKALINYRIDQILLKGYFDCEQHQQSTCNLRLQNGVGFVYFKRLGNGIAVVVNTSTDDSLGGLTKSSASVAFFRYLLGQSNRITEYSFDCTEQVILPASDMEIKFAGQEQFWVCGCDGQNVKAAMADSSLLIPDSADTGWIKTLVEPIRYAGINLPKGETDMTKPAISQIVNLADMIFLTENTENTSYAKNYNNKKYNSIWKIFVWIIITLLVIEPAIANRLKR